MFEIKKTKKRVAVMNRSLKCVIRMGEPDLYSSRLGTVHSRLVPAAPLNKPSRAGAHVHSVYIDAKHLGA